MSHVNIPVKRYGNEINEKREGRRISTSKEIYRKVLAEFFQSKKGLASLKKCQSKYKRFLKVDH